MERTSACASASARQSPTGPAPMMMTRSDSLVMRAQSALRLDHVLGGADPALVGEVEHDPQRIAIFRLVVGVRRRGLAFEVGAAGVEHLFLRGVEVVDPHAEVVEADLLVRLLLEKRDIDRAVGEIDATPRGTGALEVKGLLEELDRKSVV